MYVMLIVIQLFLKNTVDIFDSNALSLELIYLYIYKHIFRYIYYVNSRRFDFDLFHVISTFETTEVM